MGGCALMRPPLWPVAKDPTLPGSSENLIKTDGENTAISCIEYKINPSRPLKARGLDDLCWLLNKYLPCESVVNYTDLLFFSPLSSFACISQRKPRTDFIKHSISLLAALAAEA